MKTINCLDLHKHLADNGLAAFNSADGFGDSITQADKPLPSGFFTSVNTTVAPSMVGHSGDTLGYAGFLCTGSPTLLCACLPRLATRSGLITPTQGAFTMPKLCCVLLSHISFAVSVLAIYCHAPLPVVVLAIVTLGLVHIIGGQKHA